MTLASWSAAATSAATFSLMEEISVSAFWVMTVISSVTFLSAASTLVWTSFSASMRVSMAARSALSAGVGSVTSASDVSVVCVSAWMAKGSGGMRLTG